MAHQLAFPFLYIKLSGEMIYIIEQRLEGTNPAVKAFPAPSVFHLRPMASYFYCWYFCLLQNIYIFPRTSTILTTAFFKYVSNLACILGPQMISIFLQQFVKHKISHLNLAILSEIKKITPF